MKIASQFMVQENSMGEISVLKNMEPPIRELEFCDSLEDPFIEKLAKQIEQVNRFHNCFEVETF